MLCAVAAGGGQDQPRGAAWAQQRPDTAHRLQEAGPRGPRHNQSHLRSVRIFLRKRETLWFSFRLRLKKKNKKKIKKHFFWELKLAVEKPAKIMLFKFTQQQWIL